MSGARFTATWGLGGVFALPVAFTFGSFNGFGDEADKCFCVHVGPLTFILSWRPA